MTRARLFSAVCALDRARHATVLQMRRGHLSAHVLAWLGWLFFQAEDVALDWLSERDADPATLIALTTDPDDDWYMLRQVCRSTHRRDAELYFFDGAARD